MPDFRSDNALGCSPEILEALAAANAGAAPPYGNDVITERLRQRARDLFETDCDIIPVSTGTAANSLTIAAMTPPWGAVFCHEDAHVQRDEMGAPEFFTNGAKLISISGADGRLQADDAGRVIDDTGSSGRMATPSCLSLTNATEAGTVYTPDQTRALCDVAHARKVRVHVDGARFANALVHTGCSPATLSWRAGVDVLAFGATKNGVLAAEMLVVFDRSLTEQLNWRLHRSGHRISKMRFLSAQLDAYLADDLWLRNARHANSCAAQLRDGLVAAGVELLRPVEANIVFARLSRQQLDALRAADFHFYDWPIFGEGAVRLVCGFNSRPDDVTSLINTAAGKR